MEQSTERQPAKSDGAAAGLPPIAALLKQSREQAGLSHRDLAVLLSGTGPYVDPNYLVQTEAGRIRVPWQHLAQIAAFLHTSECSLLRLAGVITDPEGEAPATANPFEQGTCRHRVVEALHDLMDEEVRNVELYIQFLKSQRPQGTAIRRLRGNPKPSRRAN